MTGTAQADGSDEHAVPVVQQVNIVNKKGLHARASAKFCQTVERFDASVRVTRGQETVGGTSIMGLMMLGAAMGDSIVISAEGDGAEQAVGALCELVEAKFGED